MKEYLIFGIFIYLMKKKTTTASEIAQEFEISSRSVYRYIDALSLLGVPVVTKLGKGGGIEVVGDFCIENLCLNNLEKITLKQFIENNEIPQKVLKILNKFL